MREKSGHNCSLIRALCGLCCRAGWWHTSVPSPARPRSEVGAPLTHCPTARRSLTHGRHIRRSGRQRQRQPSDCSPLSGCLRAEMTFPGRGAPSARRPSPPFRSRRATAAARGLRGSAGLPWRWRALPWWRPGSVSRRGGVGGGGWGDDNKYGGEEQDGRDGSVPAAGAWAGGEGKRPHLQGMKARGLQQGGEILPRLECGERSSSRWGKGGKLWGAEGARSRDGAPCTGRCKERKVPSPEGHLPGARWPWEQGKRKGRGLAQDPGGDSSGCGALWGSQRRARGTKRCREERSKDWREGVPSHKKPFPALLRMGSE